MTARKFTRGLAARRSPTAAAGFPVSPTLDWGSLATRIKNRRFVVRGPFRGQTAEGASPTHARRPDGETPKRADPHNTPDANRS